MGFLREDVLKIVFKGQTNPKQIGRLEREEVSLLCFFWRFFISLLYIVNKKEFFLIVYLLWGCPFLFIFYFFIL